VFHFLRSGGSGGDRAVVDMTDQTVSKRPTIALALGSQLAPAGAGVELAAPFETITPWQWDWFDA
jgi:hypothetical protein